MADIHDAQTRSKMMAKTKNIDSKIKILVRKWLFAHGFRYQINDKRYPEKPDILLPRYNSAIFVNGCFWHGHQHCKDYRESNRAFWEDKINRNIERDARNTKILEDMRWNVVVVWECELEKNFESTLQMIATTLIQDEPIRKQKKISSTC